MLNAHALKLMLDAVRPLPWVEHETALLDTAFVVRPLILGEWVLRCVPGRGDVCLFLAGPPNRLYEEFQLTLLDIRQLNITPVEKMADVLEEMRPRRGVRFFTYPEDMESARWACTKYPRTRSEALGCLAAHEAPEEGLILQHSAGLWSRSLTWDQALGTTPQGSSRSTSG